MIPADVQRALENAGALAALFVQSEPLDQINSLKTAIRNSFEDAFAAPLRARNARTPCFCLPDELWIATWSLLDLPDCLNVSYVCHAWRTLALSAPSLWTSITLTCELEHQADRALHCTNCDDSEEIQKYVTNRNWADYILARTRNSPLSISIHTSEFSYYEDYAKDTATFLAPYIHRLETLVVRCVSASFFNELLPMLSPWPALRTLGVYGTGIQPPDTDWVFEGHITIPSLETLTLESGFFWNPHADLNFHALRTLSLSVFNASELGAVIKACPALRQLSMSPWVSVDSPNWDPALASGLLRIPNITVYLPNGSDERTIAALFEHAPGTDVVLVYRHRPPTSAALRILRSFVKPVRATFTGAEERRLMVVVSDSSRTVSFAWLPTQSDEHTLLQNWVHLPAGSVTHLECDLTRWPGVLSAFPDTASVRELTLHFGAAADVERAADGMAAFPSILTLRLRGMSPGIAVGVSLVQALVSKLRAGNRLRTLALTRVQLQGAVHDLSEVVEEARFG